MPWTKRVLQWTHAMRVTAHSHTHTVRARSPASGASRGRRGQFALSLSPVWRVHGAPTLRVWVNVKKRGRVGLGFLRYYSYTCSHSGYLSLLLTYACPLNSLYVCLSAYKSMNVANNIENTTITRRASDYNCISIRNPCVCVCCCLAFRTRFLEKYIWYGGSLQCTVNHILAKRCGRYWIPPLMFFFRLCRWYANAEHIGWCQNSSFSFLICEHFVNVWIRLLLFLPFSVNCYYTRVCLLCRYRCDILSQVLYTTQNELAAHQLSRYAKFYHEFNLILCDMAMKTYLGW